MRPWTLITPASRGIGLALTRHILRTTNVPVVATARKDVGNARGNILHELRDVDESRLTVLPLDVTDESSIIEAASVISRLLPKDENHLHLAFAIPGILHPEKSPAQIDYSNALETFKVNALGPLMLIKHFSPFLPTRKDQLPPSTESDMYEGLNASNATWATMSARVGSISDNGLGGWYSYRASKAAVNQIAKTFDNHLKAVAGERAISVALHPGTVKTDLSKEFWHSVREDKLFSPEFAAERLVRLCTRAAEEGGIGVQGRGRCWDWNGQEIAP
ncbi:hypothetical protein, variant [Verruconis gallopava]|nr:hypothetical protein, variant [Verruconis gallopava]KIW09173.1 hypothetical protein, variant [Verruconis gallopava]